MRGRLIRIILTACSLGAITLAIAGIVSAFRQEEQAPESQVRLNKVLKNEMSEMDELSGMDSQIRKYMRQWELKGLSLSIMRNDSLLFAKGYGWADEDREEQMEAYHLLRIASVSKLITAAGIMVLQEKGLLNLKDTVFGPEGILSDTLYTSAIRDRNYYRITVEDLLRHKGGFTMRGGDPMFSTRTIMMQNRLEEAPDHETLLHLALKKRLSFLPGTSQSYSNLGYLILSMIIEKVSGESYEDFIKENVLRPAGCHDFKLANNYYKERHKNEARYYVPSNEPLVPEYNNSGKEVQRCYGGNDIHSLSGAGAWVSSTPELARFVAAIDGKPEVPDIIGKASVDSMVEYFDQQTFSLGWNDTKPDSGWVRTGTFSGTSALVKYFPDGECWILVTNTSTWKGPKFARYNSGLFRSLREKYSASLPKRNLFEAT